MTDKTEFDISEELRLYIEALVNEVVIEGKSFENHKKYLSRFCKAEGIRYESLEKNLSDFFTIAEEWKTFHTKSSSMMAKIMAKVCCLSDTFVNNLLVATTEDRNSHHKEQMSDFKLDYNSSEYQELMADLVPDIVRGKEKLEMHLYFVKKIANHAGWNGDEIVTALTDFYSMYCELLQKHHDGEAFSKREKRLLTNQAALAHIDQSVLDLLFEKNQ